MGFSWCTVTNMGSQIDFFFLIMLDSKVQIYFGVIWHVRSGKKFVIIVLSCDLEFDELHHTSVHDSSSSPGTFFF